MYGYVLAMCVGRCPSCIIDTSGGPRLMSGIFLHASPIY